MQLVQKVLGRRGLVIAQCTVKPGNHGLLNFRSGKSLAGIGQRLQVKEARVESSLFQMNLKNVTPHPCTRQIDKKEFIEASFAQKLGR